MSVADNPSPDQSEPPRWYSAPFRFVRYAVGQIPVILKLAVKSEVSPLQVVVLIVTLLALVALVFSPFLAYYGVEYLFVTFAVLAGTYFLLVLQTWLLQRGQAPPADHARLMVELDLARQQAAALTDKLTAAADAARATEAEHTRLTADVAALRAGRQADADELTGLRKVVAGKDAELVSLHKLRRIYTSGVDAIATHYKARKDRFPATLEDETVITVDDTGSAHLTQRRKLRAAPKRNQYSLIERFKGTAAFDSFLEFGFDLKVLSQGRDIAYLPASSKPSEQDVLVVFLPPLMPSDPEPIEFTISCHWKGCYADLLNPKVAQDYYGNTVRSACPISFVRLIFRLHRTIPVVTLSKKGAVPGIPGPAPSQFDHPDYRTYLWEAVDVPDEGEVAVWLRWA